MRPFSPQVISHRPTSFRCRYTHRFFTQKNLSNAPVGKLDGNVGVLLPWGVGDGRLSPLWSRETPCMALEQVSMSAMMAGRQAGRSKDRSS